MVCDRQEMDGDRPTTVVLTVARARWRNVLGDLEAFAERVVGTALERAAVTSALKSGEVSLLLTDDDEIRDLNASYRSRDRATNVLSFPSLDLVDGDMGEARMPMEDPLLLGDIAISLDRAEAEADDQKKALVDHVAHLLVHGTLHLLGYDHEDDARAEVMENLEDNILKSLGFAAPYTSFQEADAMSALT